MQEYIHLDISEMLETCAKYPGYTCLIVFGSASNKKEFVEAMREMASQGKVPGVVSIDRYGQIKFGNKSVIRTSSVTETSLRGIRANASLFVDDVSQDIINMISQNLSPFESGGVVIDVQEIYNGKEIDEFLEGFSVIA